MITSTANPSVRVTVYCSTCGRPKRQFDRKYDLTVPYYCECWQFNFNPPRTTVRTTKPP